MRSEKEIAEVRALSRKGLNHCEIARRTRIPRSTVRDWLSGRLPRSRPTGRRESRQQSLGMYLGDGCISMTARGGYRLRIALDALYPGIVVECAAAMRAVAAFNVVPVQERLGERAVEVGCYWNAWPVVFPQHGPGPKHLRRIELRDWQEEIVEAHPKEFLRGLVHSDGCRCINKSMGHQYVRYFFKNASPDIRELFGHTCEQLGIGWRQPKEREISIARRKDVELLDEFIGPKH